jgi:hypothetical protein
MGVSIRSKYWLVLLVFGVFLWMSWQKANGSWNEFTLGKGIFPLQGSASVSAGFSLCCPHPLLTPSILSPATTHLCCSRCWLVVQLLSTARFCHCTPLCNHQCSHCQALLTPIVDHLPQVVSTPATACPLLHPLLVGCCIVVCCRCLLSSLHTVMGPSTLLLQDASDANC